MNRINAVALTAAALAAVSAAAPPSARAQQVAPQPPAAARPAAPPSEAPRGQAAAGPRRSGGTLQGFSVVLVVGELQGTSAGDDVPIAARKALNDMREFLPYKSYRLLDAGWLTCCSDQRGVASERRTPGDASLARSVSTLALRGPEDEEYELRLASARAENSRVLVQFALTGSGTPMPAPATNSASVRTLQRRIADADDKIEVLQRQIADLRRRVEVGVAPGAEIPKLELEVRTAQREAAELRERLETSNAARPGGGRATSERTPRSTVIDTSFTMDVGETVVVGASRPRGATKALIALVTAVPRSGSAAARD